MELPDAPSGFVRLYNYKEPFIPFEGGYGYRGVLLMDGKGDQVQCHICGEWLYGLPGHLKTAHATNAEKYKDLVGLSQTTALISEGWRENLIVDRVPPQRKDWADFTKEEQVAMMEKRRETLKRGKSEHQNRMGTCPEQLKQRIRDLAAEKGRTPTAAELAPWAGTLVRVFGSIEEAMKQARVPRRAPGTKLDQWDKKSILEEAENFHKIHSRAPVFSDYRRKLLEPDYKVVWSHFRSMGKFREALTQRLKI